MPDAKPIHFRCSDWLTGAFAAGAYSVVFFISKSLLLQNTDFRGWLMGALRSREAGQFLPGASGDFRRSLGISEYPIGLLFDLPWLLATSVPTSLLQLVFGLASCMSLYIAVVILGTYAGIPPVARQIAGFLLPLLMFIPGPVQWNAIPLYGGSFAWTASTLTVGLLMLARAPYRSLPRNLAVGALFGFVIFWANIHHLPMTLPPVLLAIGYCLWIHHRNQLRSRVLAYTLAMLIPAVLSLPVFLGTYLFGVWSIPDVAVQENIDSVGRWLELPSIWLPFPSLASLPFAGGIVNGVFIQVTSLFLLITAILFAWRHGQQRLAQIGALALIVFLVYATMYFVAAKTMKTEIGLDPTYIEIIAYPIWILLFAHLVLSHLECIATESSKLVKVLPVVLILTWGTQWTLRNYDVRLQPAEYPIQVSSATRKLQVLTQQDQSEGTLSRVIILQNQYPPERAGDEYRIRRSSNFTETMTLELPAAKVPMLNAYSHMISPHAFSLTNDLFGDGRPSWRQFSLYDRPKSTEMVSLGIHYIVSEFQITDSLLTQIFEEPFLAFGYQTTQTRTYVYRVNSSNRNNTLNLQYSFDRNTLQVTGRSTKQTTVTVPIEFSHCLHLTNQSQDSSASISRGEFDLVNLTFTGELKVRIRYENSLFQFRNCRIRDYLYFRANSPFVS
jgi:hypothetical protein